ncbi:MAG: DNA-binding protein [Sphingobacteriales bacterium]|nr:DNA-binding protein [Sphingobacteriales bacterium]
MDTIIKRVGTKEDALSLTGYKESYFDRLNASGIIPGVSKPNGKKCFYDMAVLQDWLLSKPMQTIEQAKQKAANHISINP